MLGEIFRSHSFVSSSYFNPHQAEEEVYPKDMVPDGELDAGVGRPVHEDKIRAVVSRNFVMDRWSAFAINDNTH